MTPATACPRCGTFADLTDDGWRTLCADCHRIARHWATGPFAGFTGLVGTTFRLWKELFWLTLAINLLVAAPKVLVADLLGSPWWLDVVWSVTIGSLAEGVMLSLVAQTCLAGTARVGRAFRDTTRRYFALMLVNLATNVMSVLGLLGCGVGFFFVGGLMVQAIPIALFERASAFRALKESGRRAWPRVFPLTGASFVFSAPLIALPLAFGAFITAYAFGRGDMALPPTMPRQEFFAGVILVLVQVLTAGPQLLQFVAWTGLKPAPPQP